MWVPALARGLIREDVLRSMRYCDGYTDLLGSGEPARPSLAQRAMNSPSVAAIYQHIWRPIMVAVMSLHGISLSAERERAAAALHLGGRQRHSTSLAARVTSPASSPVGLTGTGSSSGWTARRRWWARRPRQQLRPCGLHARQRARPPLQQQCVRRGDCFAARIVPEPFGVLHEMVRCSRVDGSP
jgi:hypothetical protein